MNNEKLCTQCESSSFMTKSEDFCAKCVSPWDMSYSSPLHYTQTRFSWGSSQYSIEKQPSPKPRRRQMDKTFLSPSFFTENRPTELIPIKKYFRKSHGPKQSLLVNENEKNFKVYRLSSSYKKHKLPHIPSPVLNFLPHIGGSRITLIKKPGLASTVNK